MATKVVLAKLSPTMEEGLIVKWHKNEGDAVKIENEASVRIDKGSQAEVLLFDLPPLQ